MTESFICRVSVFFYVLLVTIKMKILFVAFYHLLCFLFFLPSLHVCALLTFFGFSSEFVEIITSCSRYVCHLEDK